MEFETPLNGLRRGRDGVVSAGFGACSGRRRPVFCGNSGGFRGV